MRPLPPKATPLKFMPNTKSTIPTTPVASKHTARDAMKTAAGTPAVSVQPQPENISSPHELTAFVENVLDDLEKKFDDMSSQVLDRMSKMSSRIDTLELSIQELLNDDLGGGRIDSPTPVSGRQSSSLGRN